MAFTDYAAAAANAASETVNSGSKAGDFWGQITATKLTSWFGDFTEVASAILGFVSALK